MEFSELILALYFLYGENNSSLWHFMSEVFGACDKNLGEEIFWKLFFHEALLLMKKAEMN